MEKIIAYKGFDKDLECRDFHYEVGKEYQTEKAKACQTGFHCCENPFDVWGYYPPCSVDGTLNRFCEVEPSGDIDSSECDKLCSTKIKINAEIGLQGLIKAGVNFILERVKWKDDKQSITGYRSASTNTGDQSAATNTGDRSAALTLGYECSAIAGGRDTIAIAAGKNNRAKGCIGAWLVLVERNEYDGTIMNIQSVKVDGVKVKEDIFYFLENNEIKEFEK